MASAAVGMSLGPHKQTSGLGGKLSSHQRSAHPSQSGGPRSYPRSSWGIGRTPSRAHYSRAQSLGGQGGPPSSRDMWPRGPDPAWTPQCRRRQADVTSPGILSRMFLCV